MEEILASIRRIISEDDAAPAEEEVEAAPAPAAMAAAPPIEDEDEPLVLEDEVLELTDRIDDDPIALVSEPEIDDLDFVAPDYTPPPVAAAPAYTPPPPVSRDEPLVGAPAASSAASAFDALERSIMMPVGGRSLEDVVRELLRPMLKAWLDENLPSIVETQVAAEVERIARQRR